MDWMFLVRMQRQLAPAVRRAEASWKAGPWWSCDGSNQHLAATWSETAKDSLRVHKSTAKGQACVHSSSNYEAWQIRDKICQGEDQVLRSEDIAMAEHLQPLLRSDNRLSKNFLVDSFLTYAKLAHPPTLPGGQLRVHYCTVSTVNCEDPQSIHVRVRDNVDSARAFIELCQARQLDGAFSVLEGMHAKGILITTQMFQLLLQGCIRHKDVPTGRKVYSLLNDKGLHLKTYFGNSLIRLFCSSGSLQEADDVFCRVAHPSTHTWQAIISGYANHGQSEQAIKLYEKMQQSGFKANDYIYVAVLKACANARALTEGRVVHTHILETGYLSNLYVANSLLGMYVMCGCLDEAEELFQDLPNKDVVSWNTIIAGHAQNGRGQEALSVFKHMRQAGLTPDRITFINTLNACARIGNIDSGKEIHRLLVESALQVDVVLGSTLVDMYAKCGRLQDAWIVFDKLPDRNTVSWNAMIGGYAQQGQGQDAVRCFYQMKIEGVEPDKATFLSMLKACGIMAALDLGRQIEMEIVRLQLKLDLELGNTLVNMYSKCASLEDASRVFYNLQERTSVSWNALIGGFAQEGHGHKALQVYQQMQQDSVVPDKVTFLSVVKACSSIGVLEEGKWIHLQIIEHRLESDLAIRNSLIDMYAGLGSMTEARDLFDSFTERDLVSWNVLLGGYAQQGPCQEAIQLFQQMHLEGVVPNKATFMSIFQVCSRLGALDQAKQAHAELLSLGLQLDVGLVAVLIDMYVTCGSLDVALRVFDEAPQRNIVAWNAMIEGMVNLGHCQEALCMFEQMQQEGLKPSKMTFVNILRACGGISGLDQGRHIHAQLSLRGFEIDTAVGTALVDMYAKCGSLEQARKVFDMLPDRSAVSWNSIIGGYARHGLAHQALELFQEMQLDCRQPTDVTLLSILSACSHGGLVDGASKLFQSMSDMFAIKPGRLHYACMVDLLGRAGHVHEAENLILQMPFQPHAAMWRSLLAACQTYNKVEIGRRCFEQIVKLEPENAAAYDMMCNIYRVAGRLEDEADIRRMVPSSAVM